MPTTLETAVAKYLRSGTPAQRTREEYSTTLRKWERWGGGPPLDQLGRKEIREFLDWVYEDAAARDGRNPGRTANKVRSHLRAVMSWAWEQDIVDAVGSIYSAQLFSRDFESLPADLTPNVSQGKTR